MKIGFPVLVVTTLLISAAAPAFADCGADLKSVEPKVSAVGNAAKKDKAQKSLSLALEDSQKGNEKACKAKVAQAKKIAGIK